MVNRYGMGTIEIPVHRRSTHFPDRNDEIVFPSFLKTKGWIESGVYQESLSTLIYTGFPLWRKKRDFANRKQVIGT
jgi:hypothetical protein